MTEGQQLMETLDGAAVLIQSGWMPIRWAGWATYLLESLQEDTDAKYYEEFLRNLKDAIAARLEDGRW